MPSYEQAILVVIDSTKIPDAVAEEYDLVTVDDLLTEALGDLGVFDGDEIGPEDVTLFLYGRDADAMFHAIEPVLRDYPLTREAVVTLRYGEPGDRERVVRLSPPAPVSE